MIPPLSFADCDDPNDDVRRHKTKDRLLGWVRDLRRSISEGVFDAHDDLCRALGLLDDEAIAALIICFAGAWGVPRLLVKDNKRYLIDEDTRVIGHHVFDASGECTACGLHRDGARTGA